MSGPRIYLAGLSGAGKSTVAALAGRWLGIPAVDVDAEVERVAGRSVAALWAEGGEAAFRAGERRAVEETVARPGPAVVALGGGTLEDPETRERLARWGEGVWLDAPAEALAERIGDGAAERPLLAGRDPARMLRELAAARGPRYAALPHRVRAHGRPADAVAAAALRAVSRTDPADLGDGVRLGRGALARAAELLAEACPTVLGSVLPVVTDSRIWTLHGTELADALVTRGWTASPIALREGEAAKAPDGLVAIWQGIAALGAEPGTPLLVLGGGAPGDVGGLAAATFKRGMALALFPTTLLAQVDAAIGGKNAIDLGGIKNVVGTFHDPVLIAIDPLCPLTQTERDWRSGWAEIVKSGLIGDPDLFALCEREPEAIAERRLEVVEEAILRAARVKLRIVREDPREAGPRRALNLGHTVGHALEAAADGGLTHGEAVAIGLVSAARLSAGLGVSDPGLVERIASALAALGLPTAPPPALDPARVLALARQDKKRRGGALHAVLPVRPGETTIRSLDEARLERWIEESLGPRAASRPRAAGARGTA
ncbi:MAG TPA: shikimate kinase [Gemmatimonadota bacterium]|nr:shikimate kinase [Gemmatimonadota bacterium]